MNGKGATGAGAEEAAALSDVTRSWNSMREDRAPALVDQPLSFSCEEGVKEAPVSPTRGAVPGRRSRSKNLQKDSAQVGAGIQYSNKTCDHVCLTTCSSIILGKFPLFIVHLSQMGKLRLREGGGLAQGCTVLDSESRQPALTQVPSMWPLSLTG
ncbi:hypothetical protein H1C71_039368 [Ictidomys tridecemlineatus]|nr:hypothetical protein H1C71_039368 [Ictidomys tridecemlineatus]